MCRNQIQNSLMTCFQFKSGKRHMQYFPLKVISAICENTRDLEYSTWVDVLYDLQPVLSRDIIRLILQWMGWCVTSWVVWRHLVDKIRQSSNVLLFSGSERLVIQPVQRKPHQETHTVIDFVLISVKRKHPFHWTKQVQITFLEGKWISGYFSFLLPFLCLSNFNFL